MEKVLITGGAGYIGSHFVRYLINEQRLAPSDIVIFDNFSQGHRTALPGGVMVFEGDMRKKYDVEKLFNEYTFKNVVHFAGVLNVAESISDPENYFHTNVVGGLNLLESMRNHNCRKIVFSSSCTVYGELDTPAVENIPCRPISPYGESKLQFEQILRWYATAYQFKAVALRYFNAAGAAYGIGEAHTPEIHIIPAVLTAIMTKKPITIYGHDYDTPDGTCIRDFVHVRDLADAHKQGLDYLDSSNAGLSVFNLGSEKGSSVQEIIDIAQKITQQNVGVIYGNRRPGDASRMVADATKARNGLSWKPTLTIDDSIRDAWNWMRKNQTV